MKSSIRLSAGPSERRSWVGRLVSVVVQPTVRRFARRAFVLALLLAGVLVLMSCGGLQPMRYGAVSTPEDSVANRLRVPRARDLGDSTSATRMPTSVVFVRRDTVAPSADAAAAASPPLVLVVPTTLAGAAPAAQSGEADALSVVVQTSQVIGGPLAITFADPSGARGRVFVDGKPVSAASPVIVTASGGQLRVLSAGVGRAVGRVLTVHHVVPSTVVDQVGAMDLDSVTITLRDGAWGVMLGTSLGNATARVASRLIGDAEALRGGAPVPPAVLQAVVIASRSWIAAASNATGVAVLSLTGVGLDAAAPSSLVRDAVSATDGEVVMGGTAIALAWVTPASGGSRAGALEVLGREASYLPTGRWVSRPGVVDPALRWERSVAMAVLAHRLAEWAPRWRLHAPTDVRMIAVSSRTASGRLGMIDVIGSKSRVRLSAAQFGVLMAPPDGMPSTLAVIEVKPAAAGAAILVRGIGRGAGAGLDIWWAAANAAGRSVDDVLQMAFPGTTRGRLQGESGAP